MKRILLVTLCLLPFLTMGQITYQSTDFIEVGDTPRYSVAVLGIDTFNIDTTGSNFHWDFATLPVNSQTFEEYISPEVPGYKTSWCLTSGNLANCQSAFDGLTNIAFIASDSISIGGFSVSDVARHYKKETDSYAETMIGVTTLSLPFTFEYEKKDTILRFPLNFNQEDSTESRLVIDLNSVGISVIQTSDQKRVNKVDGWGSLTTPFQHYPNTLRMRTTIERHDTTFLDTENIILDTILVEYRWFSAGVSTPVMQASGVIVNGQESINRISYLDMLRCIEPNALFAFRPLLPIYDSASRSTTVDFTNLSTNANAFNWDFGDGNTSTTTSPSHTYLCPGNYLVQLTTSNSCNTTIIDTFNLPIFINDTSTFVPDTLSMSICPDDSILINEVFVSSPGFYVDSIPSVNGCDSTVIIELSFLDITNPDTVQSAICFGDSVMINGSFESTAGFYPDSLIAVNNCDSVIVVELSVVDLDELVSMTTDTLKANQINAIYQWIDCATNLDIPNATSQFFLPSADGNYAVRIEANGCTVQSSCISFTISALADELKEDELIVFPNPFTDQFTIRSKEGIRFHHIKIFSITGQLIVDKGISPSTETTLGFKPKAGVYFLQIFFIDGSSRTLKISKRN